jgi:nucleotide-binding universal stress UspA family protein
MRTNGRVIVGVGASATGLRALRLAVAEARLRGAALHAVRAWTPSTNTVLASTAVLAARGDLAAALVREAFADIGGPPADLSMVTATLEGPAGPMLVAYADRDDDLLVVAAPRRRLRPSVARYCLAHATCPVLAVPPDRLARHRRQVAQALRRDLAALERADG